MKHFPLVGLALLTNEVLRRNASGQVADVFSVTNVDGFTRSEEVFSKRVHSRDIANYKVVHAGEFAYNPSRVNVGSIGYLRRKDPVAISPMYVVFEIDDDLLDRDYLLYFLTGELGLAWISHMTAGSVRDTLRYSDLCRIEIPLPALLEQHRIAEILRHADQLRQLRYRADERDVTHLLPALFHEMFGDLDPEVDYPEGWEVAPLGECVSDTQYGISSRLGSEAVGTVGVLRMNNISVDGWLDLSDLKYITLRKVDLDRYDLQCGDILFNRTNSTELVGKTGIWEPQLNREYTFASYIIRVRVNDRILPEYLWAALNSPYGKAQMRRLAKQAVSMANINTTELRSIRLVVPPLPMQKQFRSSYSRLKDQLDVLQDGTETYDILLRSLLARAFTGELTAVWREAHKEELAEPAAERDRLLGLHTEEPYTIDPTTGRVVALNQGALARLVAQQIEPAVQQFQDALAENQFVEIAAQLAWSSLAEAVRPLAAEHTEVLSRILSESVANLHRGALADLGRASGSLAKSTQASLAEAARESVNALSLVLASDVAEMAAQICATLETPAPQAGRAARGSLDPLTLSLLRATEGQPAYFRAEDLAQDGVGLVEAEEHLQLLAALGFVRQVKIRGRLLYRAVDPIVERALPEGLET